MKVAFPYTGYWPYVRRGVERCTHDLATFLAAKGHDVHVIASTPGQARVAWDGDVRVSYLAQLNHPLVYKYAFLARLFHFAQGATRVMYRERPDVAWLWTNSGISWAPHLRRLWRLHYVYHMSVYWEPGRGHIAFPELGGADVVLALNHEAARLISQEFSVPCQVLPPPVDMNFFRPVSSRDLERPTVLFAADLADPRKGGALLLKAWNHVHRRMPRARLVLAGSLGVAGWLQDHNGQRLASNLNLVKGASARSTVELRGPGALDDLPDLYSRAAVTALPSIHEMFGMVLTESLACGTPVVASSSGGPGEILRGSSVGVTVDLCDTRDLAGGARAQQLADAILRAIEIARTPGSAARCREYASRWSLDQIGPMAEDVLDRAVSHEKGAMPAMDPEVAGAEVAP